MSTLVPGHGIRALRQVGVCQAAHALPDGWGGLTVGVGGQPHLVPRLSCHTPNNKGKATAQVSQ